MWSKDDSAQNGAFHASFFQSTSWMSELTSHEILA